MTLGGSFGTRMERPQEGPSDGMTSGRRSVLGWNDPRGIVLSWDGTTPGGGHSVLGWNDSRGVIQS